MTVSNVRIATCNSRDETTRTVSVPSENAPTAADNGDNSLNLHFHALGIFLNYRPVFFLR